MVDQKRFPPSELKLRRLRRSGVVAASRDVLSFGLALGFALSVFLFFRKSEVHLAKFQELITFSGTTEQVLSASWSWFVILSAQVLWPIFFVFILVGLLQTRFLVAFGAMKMDMGRLFQFSNLFENLPGRFGVSLLAVLRFIVWAAVVYILGYAAFFAVPWDSLPHILAGDRQQLLAEEAQYGADFLWRIFVAAVVCSFGIGLASRFAVGFRFQREHGMTRSEVETEYRETELSPELKRAIERRTGRRDIE